MQTFYPGTYFKEVEFPGSSRTIQGVNISMGALVGYFEKGPIGVPTKVTKANYQTIFGGPIANAFGWYAMDGFFKNGGSELIVVRVAHYTDVTDKTTLTAVSANKNFGDKEAVQVPTLNVIAKNEGVWGNNIGIIIEDDSILDTTLLEAATIGATTLKLKSVYGAVVGMKINVGAELVEISAIDTTLRTVTLKTGLVGAATINAVVKSNEFKITVQYKGATKETWENLSLDPLLANYVETVINDEGKGSAYITVEDLDSVTVFPKNLPKATTTAVLLTNGDDGLTGVADADIIGNLGAKTGIYSLAYVQECFNLFTPESCSDAVKRAMYQYCESRMDAFGIGSVPEGYTEAMAIEYRLETGNFNTSYGALYYRWGYVDDPIGVGSNPQKLIPLDGHIAGAYADHDYKESFGTVPAGETAILKGVNKLEGEMDDISNGNLNKVNINVLRSFSGKGILIWGARTLSSDSKWKYINARRIFIYAEKSIAIGTRWVVFKPTNSSTWKSLKRTVDSFLNTLPGLYGDTAAERYMSICDETINTEAVRKEGQILTKIGLNIESVGEFVIFEIGQMDEGTTLTE